MKRKLLFVTMLTILMAGCNQAGEQKAIPTCMPTPQAVLVDLAVTNTPVPETTEAPQETETPVPTATNTPMPTNTPTPTATNTPTPTPTNTPTPTPTAVPNMEEFIVRFEPDMYGKEYYDGKGIDKRYFTGGNIAGIISEELTVYTADKKSCGYIKSGAEVIIESKSEEWAAIIVGKRKIYARTEELESVLEQTRFLYEIKDINDMAMYVTGNTVVRDVPNPEGEEIGTLELGQEVTVTGKVVINRSDKIWTQIAYNGGSGYVQKEYLSVAKPTPTSTPTPTPVPTSTPTPTPAPTSTPTPTPLPEPSSKEKEAAAMKVAMEIANSILSSFPCESDWVKVNAASWAVADYCSRCTYTMEGKDYREAYGVFVKGEFSCAGATRALGMVLECMGYEWTHANPNEYTHQWCIVEMDGQMGWADGQGGFAAYGVHPQSIGLPVVIQMNGMPRAVDADGNYISNTPPEVPEMDYNPVKIQQQTEDAIKASGKNITIVWTSENSLRTEGINYIKSEYSGEEYVMRDVNQIMKKAGLYTLMEYLAVTVEKENAGEITYPQN